MNITPTIIAGTPAVVVAAELGAMLLADAGEGRDLVEAAMNEGARLVAVEAASIDPTFFQLRNGIAGEVLQKMVNYGFQFAVVGDVSAHVAASEALRDFVVECNRGREIFFVADLKELGERLAASKPRAS
jgi:hypothetical protein